MDEVSMWPLVAWRFQLWIVSLLPVLYCDLFNSEYSISFTAGRQVSYHYLSLVIIYNYLDKDFVNIAYDVYLIFVRELTDHYNVAASISLNFNVVVDVTYYHISHEYNKYSPIAL